MKQNNKLQEEYYPPKGVVPFNPEYEPEPGSQRGSEGASYSPQLFSTPYTKQSGLPPSPPAYNPEWDEQPGL